MKNCQTINGYEKGLQRTVSFLNSLEKSLSNWKALSLWALIGATVGLTVGLSVPKTYTVTALAAPEITTRSNMNGLSTLASMAGIRSSSIAMTDAMHPNLYPELIHSPSFIAGLFEMPVTIQTKDSLLHTDLYTYVSSYCKSPWWNVLIGLPVKAKEWVKEKFSSPAEPETEGYEVFDPLHLTKQQESVIGSLSGCIKASISKTNYLLSINVTMQDPVVAADLSNAILERLQFFVTGYRTSRAKEELDYYTTIEEQARNDYLKAQSRYAGYVDSHQGLSGNRFKSVERQLQNEANLHLQMYNQTAQKMLESKARIQQNTPVLAIVQPGIPPHHGGPSTVKTTIIFMLFGLALRLAWVVFGADFLFSSLFSLHQKRK